MSTTDHAITFAQHVATYLRINHEYRKSGRETRAHLAIARTAAFKTAEEASLQLLNAINQQAEPDFISRQARELISLWDRRNHVFQQLATAHRTNHWDEPASETISRLDKAEKKLKKQLDALNTILQKMAQ